MKKYVLSCVFLLAFTAGAYFQTATAAKCYTHYDPEGESNGDSCVDQVCTYQTGVSFVGATWDECGQTLGGG